MTNVAAAGKALAPWNDQEAEPYIRIQNITKKFGDFAAVNNISLDIYKGELFCLLGGSGSGKSTLLRMLAGFEAPTSGRILIDGTDVARIPPYDRPVNMMFQSYALFPHMTVEKNVAFGLQMDGLPKDEIREFVAQMLDMVKLSAFAGRKPHQLSGGQRQRVALARSLIKRPKLLLLDEPLGALDKRLRENTQFELMRIQKELGITFIVVTHDQEEAMTMASRISIMNQGEIAQTSTPKEIYEMPRSRFVADFVGSVNMFEGNAVGEQNGVLEVRSGEAGANLLVHHGLDCEPGTRVTVAIRPEKMKIFGSAVDQTHNQISGTIVKVGYMGDASIYHVELAGGKIVRVNQTIADADSEIHSLGKEVFMSWRPDSCVVLLS